MSKQLLFPVPTPETSKNSRKAKEAQMLKTWNSGRIYRRWKQCGRIKANTLHVLSWIIKETVSLHMLQSLKWGNQSEGRPIERWAGLPEGTEESPCLCGMNWVSVCLPRSFSPYSSKPLEATVTPKFGNPQGSSNKERPRRGSSVDPHKGNGHSSACFQVVVPMTLSLSLVSLSLWRGAMLCSLHGW